MIWASAIPAIMSSSAFKSWDAAVRAKRQVHTTWLVENAEGQFIGRYGGITTLNSYIELPYVCGDYLFEFETDMIKFRLMFGDES